MKHAVLIGLICLGFGGAPAAPLIIDHTAVELYDDIPAPYIAWIKTQWLSVPGESHSSGYRLGLKLVENLDTNLDVNVKTNGTPEGPTNAYLRVSSASWGDYTHPTGWRYSYGEEDWYTGDAAVSQTRAFLTYAHTSGLTPGALGFGWCWDTTWHNSPGGAVDPVHQVRWAGSSVGGPDGDLRWGLDAEDSAITSNRVCMDTYLAATRLYSDYCRTNGYATRVFFTTGPVDGYTGESGYQRHLKHEYIRQYVRSTEDECLFDYADILAWSNAGAQNLQTWTDYAGKPKPYQMIHADNMLDLDGTYVEDGDHIGQRGALRLGKALWVMMARMAGWDPEHPATVRISPAQTGGRFNIRFPAYPGYTHALHKSSDLKVWEEVPEAVPVVADGVAIFSADHHNEPKLFWRVMAYSP
jgi:hypothetical protein